VRLSLSGGDFPFADAPVSAIEKSKLRLSECFH